MAYSLSVCLSLSVFLSWYRHSVFLPLSLSLCIFLYLTLSLSLVHLDLHFLISSHSSLAHPTTTTLASWLLFKHSKLIPISKAQLPSCLFTSFHSHLKCHFFTEACCGL